MSKTELYTGCQTSLIPESFKRLSSLTGIVDNRLEMCPAAGIYKPSLRGSLDTINAGEVKCSKFSNSCVHSVPRRQIFDHPWNQDSLVQVHLCCEIVQTTVLENVKAASVIVSGGAVRILENSANAYQDAFGRDVKGLTRLVQVLPEVGSQLMSFAGQYCDMLGALFEIEQQVRHGGEMVAIECRERSFVVALVVHRQGKIQQAPDPIDFARSS